MIDISFVTAFSKYSSIVGAGDLLTGGQMYAFLGEVADQEYAAALRALSDSTLSKEPRREIGMAIQALRLAYERYDQLAAPSNLLHFYGSAFLSGLTFGLVQDTVTKWGPKAVKTASALSVLYASEREKELSCEYASLALGGYAMLCRNEVYEDLPRSRHGRSAARKAAIEERTERLRPGAAQFWSLHEKMLQGAFPSYRFHLEHFRIHFDPKMKWVSSWG